MEESKSARFVYYGLIGTFVALYLAVAFVSTLHAITFFKLANSLTLAIFLGAAFEIGQASVLFSILMTKNKHRTLAWAMMFLLTTLQVTANVFASFKFMDMSGSTDWQYWQRSILFWLEADTPEIYKVTIAWITGALLPIVALGMTALAADNIKLNHEHVNLDYDGDDYDGYEDYHEDGHDEDAPDLEDLNEGPFGDSDPRKEHVAPPNFDFENAGKRHAEIVKELDAKKPNWRNEQTTLSELSKESTLDEAIGDEGGKGFEEFAEKKKVSTRQPVNKPRGWHFRKEFIDDEGNAFSKGIFTHKVDPPKKA